MFLNKSCGFFFAGDLALQTHITTCEPHSFIVINRSAVGQCPTSVKVPLTIVYYIERILTGVWLICPALQL